MLVFLMVGITGAARRAKSELASKAHFRCNQTSPCSGFGHANNAQPHRSGQITFGTLFPTRFLSCRLRKLPGDLK